MYRSLLGPKSRSMYVEVPNCFRSSLAPFGIDCRLWDNQVISKNEKFFVLCKFPCLTFLPLDYPKKFTLMCIPFNKDPPFKTVKLELCASKVKEGYNGFCALVLLVTLGRLIDSKLQKFRMFLIFLNINFSSYSFRTLANQNSGKYSDCSWYFKKYSHSQCKQSVCLHHGLYPTLSIMTISSHINQFSLRAG